MKTVFITGGSMGIGAAAVKKILNEGWNVGFMDVNADEANKLVSQLNDSEHLLFVEETLAKGTIYAMP